MLKIKNMGQKSMFARLLCGAFAGLSMLALAPTVLAGPDDARYEACPRCEPKNLVWSNGLYDQVFLVPGSANNAQPRSLNVEPLAKILAKLTLAPGRRFLFQEDTALELAQGLVAAMNKADARSDVVFFITTRGDKGIFSGRVGNSGTAFLDEKGLNLIFGEVNVDFFSAYKASRITRPFDFGGRGQVSKVALGGEGVLHPRADWVVIPLGAAPVVAPPPLTVGGPANTQGVGDTTTYQPVAASHAAPVAVAPAAAVPVAAPAAPTPAAPAADIYQQHEARLKGLKRLREQNLITEEEYQAKRKEILKDL